MEMEKIIIINPGSTSAKYGLYVKGQRIAYYNYEKHNDTFRLNEFIGQDIIRQKDIENHDYKNSFSSFIDSIIENNYIQDIDDIDCIGIRIVAPGSFFKENKSIDKDYLEHLEESKKHSPIHINSIQREINSVFDKVGNLKMYGISDSEFHNGFSDFSKIYALPKKITEKYDLYKNGYHGISVESVLKEYKKKYKTLPEKTIVCHLGGGSSLTAVLNGKSIDNTMGYSPLSGLTMATRSGDVDLEAIITIAEKEDLDLPELRDLIYNHSGVLGISNLSDDTRVILDTFDENSDSKNALLNYTYNIKKQLGAYVALLNGVDCIIFTGSIGEKAYRVRELILDELDNLGIKLDSKLNSQINDNQEGFINKSGSDVIICVLKTEEMNLMAEKLLEVCN